MTRNRQASPQTVALLAALLDDPSEWQYGYSLSKRTGLQSGTLYPILIRLQELGLLESGWRVSERAGLPPRHVYRLTSTGLDYARSNTATPEAITAAPKEQPA